MHWIQWTNHIEPIYPFTGKSYVTDLNHNQIKAFRSADQNFTSASVRMLLRQYNSDRHKNLESGLFVATLWKYNVLILSGL
jgi:hypothetical protein